MFDGMLPAVWLGWAEDLFLSNDKGAACIKATLTDCREIKYLASRWVKITVIDDLILKKTVAAVGYFYGIDPRDVVPGASLGRDVSLSDLLYDYCVSLGLNTGTHWPTG
jgi:hypothetical protein